MIFDLRFISGVLLDGSGIEDSVDQLSISYIHGNFDGPLTCTTPLLTMISVRTKRAIPPDPKIYAPVLLVAYPNVCPAAVTKLTPGFREGE
jgi:hypothetical protein